MTPLLWSYLVYAIAALSLTAVLARTLGANGAVFLDEVFEDRPGMAEACNKLLVIGFYMLNVGYAFLIFQTAGDITGVAVVENLVNKLGQLLVSLGVIHFVNLAVFWTIRRRSDRSREVPVGPTTFVAPPPMEAPAFSTPGAPTPANHQAPPPMASNRG